MKQKIKKNVTLVVILIDISLKCFYKMRSGF